MNLHALRLFYIVAKNGSITIAAEQLRISQPAITSQIKKFENENGITLFVPQGRGIRLTEIGKQLATEASLIFQLENKMETLIETYTQGKIGTLKIAGNYLTSNFLLPKWVSYLKNQYENINIKITTLNTDEAVKSLISYQSDIAILGGGATNYSDKIDVTKIIEDDIWFVSAPNHKYANKIVSLNEIMLESFIMREKGSYMRSLLKSICNTAGICFPNVMLEFNGLHETLTASMAGYGINFCSSIAVKKLVNIGILSRIYVKNINYKNKIVVCVRKNETRSQLVKNFISIIENQTL
ncbi:LysR family transcriptional regulator [Clostridium estertheticum]|uniref:LysR family transcriptional regulator n=1 Tax=Clostridium estertheticum TaxID=238834 RepID=UPI001CF27A73|nr:LysR family transcriptional regulator [Clostridium estertheticum]MCB2308375.1 LysR family transcriptional regulator [Clostridium estertheticum]MCB2346430.1 LysR family transcriptional regulator [Clostridium estertheticum]MCB2349398.1 LysR family transcriptional regulator [Clostridium estertheticum]WAG46378.1 LysR family transcriptional regulator [Clostridium estertheticum]